MAITAKLQFGDNCSEIYSREYLVVDWRGHFTTPHTNISPNGHPICEHLDLVMMAPGKDDLSLYEWFIEGAQLSGRLILDYSGSIHSDTTDAQQILFENAQCYGLSEQYNIDDHTRRLLTLKIVPESITISDICFEKNL